MKLTLKIDRRHVYGAELFYPACSYSRALADIAGTRTLTPTTLRIAKQVLGFTLEFTSPAEPTL